MRLVALVLIFLLGPSTLSAQDLERFTERCRGGEVPACNVAGLMLETGAAGGADLARALDLYRLACAGGSVQGCTSVGLLYQKGLGVERDREVAAGQYRVACDAGGLLACDLLADLRAEGPVTERRHFHESGRVLDDDAGEPLGGVLVDVERLGLHVLSDATGSVTLGRVPEGTYELRAELVGYEPVAGVLNVPGYSEFVLLLDRIDGLDRRRRGRLWGTVSDGRGRGVGDATVAVVGHDGARVRTDARGRFALSDLEPGLVEVRISVPDGVVGTVRLVVQPGRTAQVHATLRDGELEVERPS